MGTLLQLSVGSLVAAFLAAVLIQVSIQSGKRLVRWADSCLFRGKRFDHSLGTVVAARDHIDSTFDALKRSVVEVLRGRAEDLREVWSKQLDQLTDMVVDRGLSPSVARRIARASVQDSAHCLAMYAGQWTAEGVACATCKQLKDSYLSELERALGRGGRWTANGAARLVRVGNSMERLSAGFARDFDAVTKMREHRVAPTETCRAAREMAGLLCENIRGITRNEAERIANDAARRTRAIIWKYSAKRAPQGLTFARASLEFRDVALSQLEDWMMSRGPQGPCTAVFA